jgi:hypothetical protein
VGVALGQVAVELVDVHPESLAWTCRGAGRGSQADLLAVRLQPGAGERFSEGIEGATKGGPATGAVIVGPKEVDQGVAPVALAGDGKVGQEGDGFAPVQLDGHAVALDDRRAKQIQGKAGHQNTSLMISVLEIGGKVNRVCGNVSDEAIPTDVKAEIASVP